MARWGSAKVEFQALAPEIKRRIDGGETLKSIYDDLRGAGRVTMSRAAFYKNKKAYDGVGPRRPSPVRSSAIPSLPLAGNQSAVAAVNLPVAVRAPAAPGAARAQAIWEGEDAADDDELHHERDNA